MADWAHQESRFNDLSILSRKLCGRHRERFSLLLGTKSPPPVRFCPLQGATCLIHWAIHPCPHARCFPSRVCVYRVVLGLWWMRVSGQGSWAFSLGKTFSLTYLPRPFSGLTPFQLYAYTDHSLNVPTWAAVNMLLLDITCSRPRARSISCVFRRCGKTWNKLCKALQLS